MSTLHNYDDSSIFSDFQVEEDAATLTHRKLVRKLLEDKLEQKRLREEMDELNCGFDWKEFEKR